MGVSVGPCHLLCVAWADDMWLHARNPEELHLMLREFIDAAKVGLALRLSKCRWAEVRRADPPAQPAAEEHAELREMATVATTSTMHVLGAEVHMQVDQDLEFASAHLSVGSMQRALCDKLRILHISVYACFAWARGTRQWTAAELQQLKSMQVRIRRRLARWYPAPEEDWPSFARRCSNSSQVQWRQAGVHRWDHAVAASWWRWAGHAARLSAREPHRRNAAALGWKDAWWRQGVRYLHANGDKSAPSRLSRGHSSTGHGEQGK